jgi:hypothetical protein
MKNTKVISYDLNLHLYSNQLYVNSIYIMDIFSVFNEENNTHCFCYVPTF